MQKVFSIYLSFLQVGQSETLLRHVFASFRAFLNNYSIILFQGTIFFTFFLYFYTETKIKKYVKNSYQLLILQEMLYCVDVYVMNYYVVVIVN